MSITMEEVLLRGLKRVAQEEGPSVHKLVVDIILSHLNRSKAMVGSISGGRFACAEAQQAI
jgi:hypothetical protein